MGDTLLQPPTPRSTRVCFALIFLMMALVGADRYFDPTIDRYSARGIIAMLNLSGGIIGLLYNLWAMFWKR